MNGLHAFPDKSKAFTETARVLKPVGKKFAEKLGLLTRSVSESVDVPCVLVTRNVGRGKIPRTTEKFLKKYSAYIKGVIING
jgi:protein involved in ribonucleotide reduction